MFYIVFAFLCMMLITRKQFKFCLQSQIRLIFQEKIQSPPNTCLESGKIVRKRMTLLRINFYGKSSVMKKRWPNDIRCPLAQANFSRIIFHKLSRFFETPCQVKKRVTVPPRRPYLPKQPRYFSCINIRLCVYQTFFLIVKNCIKKMAEQD